MIRNCETLRRFEQDLIRKTPADYRRNLALVEALYREAVELGAFPPADPWLGLDTVLGLARAINRV